MQEENDIAQPQYALPKKKYDYPLRYDEHMITVKILRPPLVLDANFPYVNRSFRRRLWQFFTYAIVLFFIAFPLSLLRMGLRIKGRKNLKKNKELLKNGAVSICNHVHWWDGIAVAKAIRRRMWIPGWAGNFQGKNAGKLKGIGTIPIPESYGGKKAFSKALDGLAEEGAWIHYYPEGSLWFYYDAIRPFKTGAFRLAVKHNKPIVPMCFTYRPLRGLHKLFRRGGVSVTLHVGEPTMPDLSLPYTDAIEDLLTRSREKMHQMSGFHKRIDQSATEREEDKYIDTNVA
ncbi:MAG: 1-acyl-sn-glycerol-3-phosphate acyltransferase [Firmicutes bacterium]|nr:1-acyl-sn-glycerol-3-phosphate acyltransferase [Bacillota bacterium]